MILGMEIGLAIFGILAIVRGRMVISKTKVVVGIPARLLGLLSLSPLPLAFMAGMIYAIREGVGNPQGFALNKDEQLKLTLIEGGIVVVIAILVFAIGAMIAITPQEAARRERLARGRDDYDDEDDRYDDERYEDDRHEDDDDRDRNRRSRNR